MDSTQRSPARVLAPTALAIFAVAMLVILSSGGGSSPSSSSSGPSSAEQRDLELRKQRAVRRRASTPPVAVRSVYIVRTGDTLGGIAQRTGVPVTRLQELNPTLDPQALVSGQRIKLR